MTDTQVYDLPDDCPNCGAAATGAGAFCARCGEPLAETPTHRMRPVAPLPPRPPAPRRPEPPGGSSDRSVLAIFAVGLALILVLVAVALYVGGVFNSTNAPNTVAATPPTTSSPTNTNTTGGTTPSYTAPLGHEQTTFTAQVFTIEYPSGWKIKNNEKQESWGTDTTIVSPADPNTYLRVDVTPNTTATSPRTAAQPVIAQLEKEPGYKLVDLSPETLNGSEALHWEFRVEDHGVTLHKEDVFLIAHNGNGVAVLTQAPDSNYEASRGQFATLRKSLTLGST